MSKVWLNRAEIVGNLGHGAELRYTGNGTPVMTFDVAVTKPANTQGEGHPEETTWFKCVVWGKLAEAVKPKMLKGTQVYFCGEMTCRKWQDKNQNQRTTWELVSWNRWAHQLIILNPGREIAAANGAPADRPEAPGAPWHPGSAPAAPTGMQVPRHDKAGDPAPGATPGPTATQDPFDPDLPF